MDEIALREKTQEGPNVELFDFLKNALEAEVNPNMKKDLFKIVFRGTSSINYIIIKKKLLSIIAEFTKSFQIKELFKEKNLVSLLITEYSTSRSYDIAGLYAEIIYDIYDFLDDQDLNAIVKAALSNNQMTNSYNAKFYLEKILTLAKGRIPNKIAKKLEKAWKSL